MHPLHSLLIGVDILHYEPEAFAERDFPLFVRILGQVIKGRDEANVGKLNITEYRITYLEIIVLGFDLNFALLIGMDDGDIITSTYKERK